MKLIRKKRISIDNLESLKNKKGIIFVSSSYNCYSNKKPIKINKTNIYYKDKWFINLVNNKGKITNITLLNKYKLDKESILDIIDIYKGKLYIVILDNTTNIENFEKITYLDLFKLKSESIYNDIFNYNKSNYSNCYLNKKINDQKSFFSLKLFNLYYFLIGYI